MAIGLLIIGDEILSGKRTDQHFSAVLKILAERGLQLGWAQYLGDDPAQITATLRRTFASSDIVFSCGGIGATPDDHTRQCAAAALGKPLVLHPFARERIEERMRALAAEKGEEPVLFGKDFENRLKMGEFPQGAEIIPNPFNRIPGFSYASHYFVPGFPVMAHPMIAWVLDTYYADSFHQVARAEKALLLYDTAESTVTPMMEDLERQFPLIKVFSLPSVGDANIRRHIELGVKGEPGQVEAAFAAMLQQLQTMQAPYEVLAVPK